MKKTIAIISVAAAMTFAASSASAADPVRGQKLYQDTCAACHGDNGISIAPIYPNVAGQKEEYLNEQMRAYRDGTRKNDIMAPMAQGLSNIDIAHLSAFIARLRP